MSRVYAGEKQAVFSLKRWNVRSYCEGNNHEVRAFLEPRTANREPRTANREPRTVNREP
jgi:hypothetical protein